MAVTMSFYEQFIVNLGEGAINMTLDDFKVILVNSYSYDASHDELADVVASEISGGNGYTTGGQSLSSQTWGWNAAESRVEFDAGDSTWTAAGGSIGPATGAIIYSDTSTGDKLVAYIDFGGSESAGDGTDFKITYHQDGIFVIA